MELANCSVALGGDKGNTVPKFGITAAEIAVLRFLHGEDAVTDIQPIGHIERLDRVERARLVEVYGVNHEGRMTARAVDALFPGAAARVFHALAEQDIPEEFFAATGRSGGKTLVEREPDSIEAQNEQKADIEPEPVKTVEKPAKAPRKKRQTKAEKAAEAKAAAAQAAAAKAAAEQAADAPIGEDMDDSVLD